MRSTVEEGAHRVSLAAATNNLGESFRAANLTHKPDIVRVAHDVNWYLYVQTILALGD